MDTQDPSAPACAESRTTGKNHPRAGGLTHENTRHTTRFTVIGNHLAQHEELSLLAIGLAVHLQSLRSGARIDIKTLTARFPEGATRIAAALRELETHGYLRRERSRIPGGRIVTRTVSCNQPGRHGSAPEPSRPPARRPAPDSRPPRKKLPTVPQPAHPVPTLLQTAVDLLVDLRRHDPRLLLSSTDADHLAPGVAAWLERELTPTAIRHALTADLPEDPLRRPAALLAHRLAAQLPPFPPYRAPVSPQDTRHPLRNCDGCDHAFRSPQPGMCPTCAAAADGVTRFHGSVDAVPAG
ncbi:helix-turn-helix domain-containing protein [Streptomyces soliscabiei]|uniref:helix-turn-helix domain-containing protein n=1 Tax=Streptomyces soliscabiei TaxID=588897 RepID=UPI0029A90940|nr:helix-turn-helix domain-containing protein [Streptomyces sp. NY05-11A]MDX2678827.1 helix-turn-helix domain-containing protein [Streptomyces sp. NY05-11A]